MLDKKQIQVFFYLSSKCVIKQQRQLRTSAPHLAQELLMNIQCSGGSRSFTRETKTLKMRSVVSGHQKLTETNWKLVDQLDKSSWSSYIRSSYYMRSCWKINLDRSMAMQHLKQIGKVKKIFFISKKWKKLGKWVPHKLTVNQKIIIIIILSLKCCLLFYAIAKNHFLMNCDIQWKVDFIWQLEMTSSVIGLEKKLQSTSQSRSCTHTHTHK